MQGNDAARNFTQPTEIRLAPSVSAMNAFMEPHRQWIEKALGCPVSESVTFELEVPFGQIVAEDLLHGTVLDRQCLVGADLLRPLTVRWEVPPTLSPRIQLIQSRDQNSPITSKNFAWDPHWKETPVALWLQGLTHALIGASVPYVSFAEGIRHKWQEWVIVNRSEIAPALNLLSTILAGQPRRIVVVGGREIPMNRDDPGWDSLVLDSSILQLVKRDFEFFFQREAWFRKFRLPFRRGYLFYGPPGNGKTSVVRAMASHPGLHTFTLDFSNEELRNDALTELFEAASHGAPSLVIFEDLDRLYGNQDEGQNRTRITLQHLLNCLDGLGSKDGIIVVATANHVESLDPAILRRPGRFDRVVPFNPPRSELRREYLTKLTADNIGEKAIAAAATLSEGFSFAQLREAYILAGQIAFQRNSEDDDIGGDDLLAGVKALRNSANGVDGRLGEREAGFARANGAAVA
jgi:hypothetical protein